MPDFPGIRVRHLFLSPPAFFLEDRCKLIQKPPFRPAFLDRRINRAPDVLEKIQLGDARNGEGAGVRFLPEIMPVFGNGNAF